VTTEAQENAARAHFALRKLLADEQADGLTMNCLRRGMLKPCVSFATLNSQLAPAACENDFPAVYTQLLGQWLIGRPGFQPNPCYDTERNHYYASHCTCPTKMYGPDGAQLPYLLRRFAHTNEGSCAVQVFWKEGDPVTMVRYYPGQPPALDVYAGTVVRSHPMPLGGGCTTNVEIELTDRDDACLVTGHHNLLLTTDIRISSLEFVSNFGFRDSNLLPVPAPDLGPVTESPRLVSGGVRGVGSYRSRRQTCSNPGPARRPRRRLGLSDCS
jgi:hypothetical protein